MKRRLLLMVVLVLGAAGAYTSVARATPSRASDCSSSDAVSGSISVSGGTATGSFTVAAGCSGVEVSLVSYQAPRGSFDESIADRQVRYREVTESFDAGRHTLAVDVPDCYFQVDLVTGAPIEKLGPSGSDNFYGAQGRLVDAANGVADDRSRRDSDVGAAWGIRHADGQWRPPRRRRTIDREVNANGMERL